MHYLCNRLLPFIIFRKNLMARHWDGCFGLASLSVSCFLVLSVLFYYLASINPLMKSPQIVPQRIFSLPELKKQIALLRLLRKTIAFTNGCFDILHQGHIYSLSEAAKEADYLIVGLNSDDSVRKLKGHHRPINGQDARASLLASLLIVDAVIVFEEDTPLELIK